MKKKEENSSMVGKSIEKMLRKQKIFFEYLWLYPHIIDGFKNLPIFMQYFKKVVSIVKPLIEPLPKLEDEKFFMDNYIGFVHESNYLFKTVETEIITEENKITYKYPTFCFYFNKIKTYARKLETPEESLTYLNYCLNEYSQHISRRMNIYNYFINLTLPDKTNTPNNELDKIIYVVEIFKDNAGVFAEIMSPATTPPPKFEDRIKYEIDYYLKKVKINSINKLKTIQPVIKGKINTLTSKNSMHKDKSFYRFVEGENFDDNKIIQIHELLLINGCIKCPIEEFAVLWNRGQPIKWHSSIPDLYLILFKMVEKRLIKNHDSLIGNIGIPALIESGNQLRDKDGKEYPYKSINNAVKRKLSCLKNDSLDKLTPLQRKIKLFFRSLE